jgi:hypothetical protein
MRPAIWWVNLSARARKPVTRNRSQDARRDLDDQAGAEKRDDGTAPSTRFSVLPSSG